MLPVSSRYNFWIEVVSVSTVALHMSATVLEWGLRPFSKGGFEAPFEDPFEDLFEDSSVSAI